MKRLKNKISILSVLLFSFLYSQSEVDALIQEVYAGNLNNALESIYELKREFPENPSVMFLDALLNENPEEAIKKFKKIYNLYEDSKYADDAVMKIAEFYYTNGSYVKSSEWVKKINLYYSNSEHIDRSLNLYVRTLVLTGKEDTARLFMETFKRKYPDIELDKHPKLELEDIALQKKKDNQKLSEELSETVKEKNKILKAVEDIKNAITAAKRNKKDNFSIQVGAYGNHDNASKVRDELIELGFSTRIDVIHLKTKNKDLYAVREGYFRSKEFASNTQKKIKSRAGYNSIIVDINKY